MSCRVSRKFASAWPCAAFAGSYLIIAPREIAAKYSYEFTAPNTGDQRHVNKFARFGTTLAAAESERGVVAKPASESYGSPELVEF